MTLTELPAIFISRFKNQPPSKGRKIKEKSRYYQSIARHFFIERGAPFFLSSKELDLIAKWERMEIPLFIVLEGIKNAFGNYRRKPGRKARIQSLGFCNLQVLRAYEQYRERRVGQKKGVIERNEKRKRAKAEMQRFLETIPLPIEYLKEKFSQAEQILSQARFDEEQLERIEEEVEELLFMNTPEDEKGKIKAEVLVEYEFREKEEFLRIFKIKLMKFLRGKYKIPYVSLYHY